MVSQKIGRRIRGLRKKKGLTQEALAEILNLSPHHYSSLERGEYSIKLETLVLIINTLGCSSDDIFCDVIENGYKIRTSRLSDMIEKLPTSEQTKILNVVEALVNNTI